MPSGFSGHLWCGKRRAQDNRNGVHWDPVVSSVCLEKVTTNLQSSEVAGHPAPVNRESPDDLEGDRSVEAAQHTSSLLFLPAAPCSVT